MATGAAVSNAMGKVATGTETGRKIGKSIGDTVNKYAPSVGNYVKSLKRDNIDEVRKILFYTRGKLLH